MWVRGTSGLPFLRIPIFEQKSVGQDDSRITRLDKFFVTQKENKRLFIWTEFLVSQAKWASFWKLVNFRYNSVHFQNQSGSLKTPILSNSHFWTKKCGSTPLQKTQTIPFYRIPILSNTYCIVVYAKINMKILTEILPGAALFQLHSTPM